MADESRIPKLETLLAAAAKTFAARGYGGTSMRDIAHDSGISLSGIYYYTRGKASLLFEIQSRTIDALLSSAEVALSGISDPKDQLLKFIENHISYMNENPAFVRVLSHETADGEEEKREGVTEKRRSYVRMLHDILQRVAAEYDSSVSVSFAGDMLFAMMSGPNQLSDDTSNMDRGQLGRRIYSLFLNGLSGSEDISSSSSSTESTTTSSFGSTDANTSGVIDHGQGHQF